MFHISPCTKQQAYLFENFLEFGFCRAFAHGSHKETNLFGWNVTYNTGEWKEGDEGVNKSHG